MNQNNQIGPSPVSEAQTTAKARYNKLATKRQHHLDRARSASKLTLPFLVPPQGATYSTKYSQPWQSLGARGVENLASKLTLSLFPPNTPFFKLTPDRAVIRQALQAESGENIVTDIETALVEVERMIQDDIEASGDRIVIEMMMLHLLISGNACLYKGKDGTKLYPLYRYVSRRDALGQLQELITVETVATELLPEELQKTIYSAPATTGGTNKIDESVEIYTHVRLIDKRWISYQEVKGQLVPDSEGNHPIDNCPWNALRLYTVEGEDYGRGHVEKYLGDLSSLEGLTRAIVEGSAAAAKVLFLVNPNGTTKITSVSKAQNGAIIQGNAADVSTLQVQKFNDFRVALDTINQIAERLSFAFLLNTSIQRQAERVTAEEIRFMAEELETSLGGIYSLLSKEFQLPYIRRCMYINKNIPTLPSKLVKPIITTGLEALGRGNDRNKLVGFIKTIAQLGPEALKYIKMDEAIARLAQADGIDPIGLVVTEEEIAQQQQQAQAMALTQKLGPQAIKSLSDNYQQASAGGQTPQGIPPEAVQSMMGAMSQQAPQAQQ